MGIKDYLGRDRKRETASPFEEPPALRGGGAAGFTATLVSLVPILALDADLLSETIAGMYGFEDALLVGLVAHLVHGALFGVVFAFILADPVLVRITDWLWKTILAGSVYGLVLALVGMGFLLPVWLEVVGTSAASKIPFITPSLVGWHVLYGFVLGALFPIFEGL